MIVTTLHLSKLALLTQRGTVPDVEAALERHCSQLVDLVRISFKWRFDGKKILTWWYFDGKKIPKPWCLFYPTRHHRPRCQRWSPRTRPSFSGPTPSIAKTTTRIADSAWKIPSHRRCRNQQQSEARSFVTMPYITRQHCRLNICRYWIDGICQFNQYNYKF